MAISIPIDQARRALQALINQGEDLLPNPEPGPYQEWKSSVRSTIGLIYGTVSPEMRDIEDGFWWGENSAPPPPPNRVKAVQAVLVILQRQASTIGEFMELIPFKE